MEMSEYLKRASELFRKVEDKLDEYEDETDYDYSDGKLQLIFENGTSPIVINTQRPLHEIWLAGGTRAWHFKWLDKEETWFAEAEKEEFYQCLGGLIGERIGQTIAFS